MIQNKILAEHHILRQALIHSKPVGILPLLLCPAKVPILLRWKLAGRMISLLLRHQKALILPKMLLPMS